MFNIAPVKILFTLFALFAWSRAVLKFRTKLMNTKELTFWSLLWFFLIVAIFIPGKANFLAKLLGLENGLDAMFFFGIVALFYAIYRLYIKANETEQVLTELVRQIALKNIKSRKKRKK